jgi:hypothetical protein
MVQTPSLLSRVAPLFFSDVALKGALGHRCTLLVNGLIVGYRNGPTRYVYIATTGTPSQYPHPLDPPQFPTSPRLPTSPRWLQRSTFAMASGRRGRIGASQASGAGGRRGAIAGSSSGARRRGRIEGSSRGSASGRRGAIDGCSGDGGWRRGHNGAKQLRDARGRFKAPTPARSPTSSSSGGYGDNPTSSISGTYAVGTSSSSSDGPHREVVPSGKGKEVIVGCKRMRREVR